MACPANIQAKPTKTWSFQEATNANKKEQQANNSWYGSSVPSRELTYPTAVKGKFWKLPFNGMCLFLGG